MNKQADDLRTLIRDMTTGSLNTLAAAAVPKNFELCSDPLLLEGLSGWLGAFTVRAMLRKLQIDEHHIFKWRPENKYNQYLILNAYAPGCMPKTFGLTSILRDKNWISLIRKLIGSGYFIKATLGFGSGRTKSFDRTSEIEQILNEHTAHFAHVDTEKVLSEKPKIQDEKWIVQKKLRLKKEFRIHSFGKDILYGMTFRISGAAETGDFDEPQEFTRLMIEKLPESLLKGTLIGWDIGLTKMGKYYVIEANFTGFHPEYHTGFQTSGYFEEAFCGPMLCAWLNAYFRDNYRVSIAALSNELITKAPFMEELSFYLSVFKNEHIRAIRKAKGTVAAVYIYLGKETDFLMIKLISHFQMANFARTYYIITPDDLSAEAMAMFKGEHIVHLSEQAILADNFIKEKPCLIL